jgi:hypothetical protein
MGQILLEEKGYKTIPLMNILKGENILSEAVIFFANNPPPIHP